MTAKELEDALEGVGSDVYDATAAACRAHGVPTNVRAELSSMVLAVVRCYRSGVYAGRVETTKEDEG